MFSLPQILLKDIEAHGPVLKSVLRQYERIAAAAASVPSAPSPLQPSAGDRAGAAPQDPLAAPQRPQQQRRGAKDNIPRKARSLEKRWHQIYLRSLEWHYYLEGVIANFKVRGGKACSCDTSNTYRSRGINASLKASSLTVCRGRGMKHNIETYYIDTSDTRYWYFLRLIP